MIPSAVKSPKRCLVICGSLTKVLMKLSPKRTKTRETDTGAIEAIIVDVLANNQAMVDEYKGGKEKAF